MSIAHKQGYFGEFGGCFAPETLMTPLAELALAYEKFKVSSVFQEKLTSLLRDYVGRPTSLYYAQGLTQKLEGAQIYLKREDLTHTGAHKINNTIGQGLLALFMGKKRLIAETGAGQHGVATATVASLLGLPCTVFMGAKDVERQRLNVLRMKALGAQIKIVHSGSQTLKDATSEALREWVTNQLQGMFQNLASSRTRTRKMRVKEALKITQEEEASKLINDEDIKAQAIEHMEQHGIVFLDEIDKVTQRHSQSGADVSREGVQRDLLPLVEGCTVSTKYGMAKTDHT